jgi:hypothetical protein
MSDPARISPGGRRELGLLNWTISRFAARSIRAPEMHLFTTLGRHRLLFLSFLRPGRPLRHHRSDPDDAAGAAGFSGLERRPKRRYR